MLHLLWPLLLLLRIGTEAYPKEGGHFVRRDYELGFIIHPEATEEQTRAIIERISTIVNNHDGEVVRVNQWGRRRLAYPINHLRDGNYVFVDMILTPETVAELDRTLKVTEEVMRHLIIKRDAQAAAAAQAAAPVEQEQEQEIAEQPEETAPVSEEEAPVEVAPEEIEEFVPPAIEEDETVEA